jgi:hypothetical protein
MLMTAALMMASTGLAVGQTSSKQPLRGNSDEQQIITLSRQFADEAMMNDATVAKHVSGTRPERLILVEDGEANPLAMDQIKVTIKGNKATLTSRLVVSGRRSNGEAYEHFHSWTTQLVKRGERWQVASAQMGSISK